MVFSISELLVSLVQSGMVTVGIPGLVMFAFIESIGIPVFPSEIVLPFSGILLAQGAVGFLGIPFNWGTVLVAALVGCMAGATFAFLIGQRYGMSFIRTIGRHLSMDEKDLQRAEGFFSHRGEITVFIARWVPLIRDYISYPAGAARMKMNRFSLFTFVGAFPFTLLLVYAGFVLGKNLSVLDPYFTLLDVVGVCVVVVLVFLFVRRKLAQSRASQLSGQ
jgi:membrane protein DedA with SNARE-associated domain